MTPKITVKKDDVSLKDYKKVYLFGPKEDPRKVLPRVAVKLQEMGYEVRECDPEKGIDEAQGSGFLISSKGHILTCEHVLIDKQEATVWIKGERFEAEVLCTDKDKDLALLKIKDLKNAFTEPLRFAAASKVKMGQDVYTMGFPLSNLLGNQPRLNKGLVSSAVGLKDNPDQIQISVEIQAGNSGGPLLNEHGQVLGVIQQTINPLRVLQQTGGTLPQNVNFAIKTDLVKEFLKKCKFNEPIISWRQTSTPFDQAKNSVAQVRAGIIPPGEENLPKLVCVVYYISVFDLLARNFRVFHMGFYDYESGDLLLEAGQYREDPLSTEDKVIENTFQAIKTKAFH